MRRSFTLRIPLLALVGLVLLANLGQAQTRVGGGAANAVATQPRVRPAVQQQLDLIKQKVTGITPAQEATILGQLNTAQDTVDATARSGADSGTRVRKGQAAFRTADTNILNALTPAQQGQYRSSQQQLYGVRGIPMPEAVGTSNRQ
jgi:hypothetical protein